MNQAHAITCAALLGMLTSCEKIIGAGGHVLSRQDGSPLDDVRIEIIVDGQSTRTMHSDASGYFSGSQLYGCVPSCPSVVYTFHKEGYEDVAIDFDTFFVSLDLQHQDTLKVFMDPFPGTPP